MKRKKTPLFRRIRQSKAAKVLALLISAEIVVQTLQPLALSALTSGPTQPEVQGFQPIGLTEMVDPFSGDFSYSIPLLDIGGYPLNLAYQSGISMDQEASWVGLGWNLHTGAITRQMRGLPDDFAGEEMTDHINMKPNTTVGVNVAFDMELFGFEANSLVNASGSGGNGTLSVGLGVEYNNYAGLNVTTTMGLGLTPASLPMNANLNLTSGNDGLQISPNVSYSAKLFGSEKSTSGKASLGIGASINSRKGQTDINLNGGVTVSAKDNVVKEGRKGKNGKIADQDYTGSGSSGGISNSSSISFGTHTFAPSIENAMESFSFSGKVKIGGATVHQDFGGSISGYGSVQKLTSNTFSAPAYGYIYSEKANNNDDALLDYNREKDGSFSPHHKHLPLTALTNDFFSIAAQGLGGTFRAFRNDVGYVYNNKKFSPSNSGSLGVEIGIGQVVDVGIDGSVNVVQSTSGPWRDDNLAIGSIPFREKKVNDLRENYFLRMTGEKIPEQDPAFLSNTVKGTQAIRYNLKHQNGLPSVKADNKFSTESGGTLSGISNNERVRRQPRNTAVYFLTAAELKAAYPHKRKNISQHAKPHHIAEIIVVTPEGMRYVFGLAAYNTKQVERSFAVGGTMSNPNGGFANGSADNERGLVNYNATAASTSNDKGIDNYFKETITPAFAHSWMLTEILSPDYSDLKGDGPTQDDLGAYVLFKYGDTDANGNLQADIKNYGWRTPTAGAMKAGYMEGLRTNPTDDKASVVYGTKDIWYCHSIESKTHKVLFEFDDRQDGLGVDPNGNVIGTQQQKRIESITYTSIEATGSTPPVKKIHFVYDYLLCPGTPNSTAPGAKKLTLTKLYFTYENSNAGMYSPYKFSYMDKDAGGNDFSYVHGNNDRWGILKKSTDNPDGMSNGDYPYAVQNAAKQAEYAAAWSMNRVELPSGGKISVTYESDDYAYVQDRRAANMYMIAGFSKTKDGIIKNQTFIPSETYDYLIVNVPDAGSMLSSDEFRKRYLQEEAVPGDTYGPLRYLYFRFLMNVNKPGNPKYEYVSGYAEIDRTGDWCGMRNGTQAYIKVKTVLPNPGGTAANPFAYAAWAFSRSNTPEYAYNQPPFGGEAAEQIIMALTGATLIKNIFEMLLGVNNRMRLEGYGSHVDTDRSWVKLFDPDGRKYGAGLRVKRLEIDDSWNQMSPNETSRSYGQEYSYTLEDGRSSGVAAWEPAMGSDENPFKLPVYNDDPKVKLVMEERFYVEEPFGESFMPAPGVGYSRIEVKDIVYNANVTSLSTGKMVHEFYTAKDFPSLTRYTKINPVLKKSNPIVSLLSFNSWNLLTTSQGYTIEVNDMHGKPKAQRMYAENATQPFAYTEHYYRTDAQGKLSNNFPVLDRNRTLTTEEVGVEYDMVVDFREQNTEGITGSLAFNIGYAQLGPIPTFSFSLFPGFKRDHSRFRSVTVTKLIQRYGLEEKQVSYDKGALLETRTVALDKMTGNTVVQELTNEYRDKYYKTDMPAHWVYPGMAQASQNVMFMFGSTAPGDNAVYDRTTGIVNHPGLVPGDEVFLHRRIGNFNANLNLSSNAYRYWVAQDGSTQYLIDHRGQKAILNSLGMQSLIFSVVRSGHRNMQQTPLSTITSLGNPVQSGSFTLNSGLKTISTDAQEYKEQWHTDYSVPIVSSQEVMTLVGHSEKMQSLLDLLNQMAAEGKLSQAGPNPLPAGYTENGTVNSSFLEGLTGCAQSATALNINAIQPATDLPFMASVLTAFGYSAAGNNSMLSLALDPGNGCSGCDRLYMISTLNTSGFGNNDWRSIQEFQQVLSSQTLALPGFTEPVYCHLLQVKLITGAIRTVILADPCYNTSSFTYQGYSVFYDCLETELPINPYIANILGNWRTYKSWVFQGDRNNTDVAVAENLRRDGYLPSWKSFWNYDNVSGYWKKSAGVNNTVYENWNWTNEMTIYSPYGFDLENKNPLGIFSAAIYGFKNMLALGLGSNGMNKEIAYDGFEDYYSDAFSNECARPHSWFADDLNQLVSTDAHTGKYAMRLTADHTRKFAVTSPLHPQQVPTVPYFLNDDDLLTGFSPNPGQKRFVLSFWAKGTYTNGTLDYPNISADVRAGITSWIVAGSLKKTDLVEGWQKFEYLFEIPSSVVANTSFNVTLKPNSGGQPVLFDDIRIHPFDGNMKSYSYDRENFRFNAELDENNFATFYEYDEEGKLVRVKKETERGVMTLQETRTNNYKR
ncbi:MAG: hypothetical protein ACT6QS_02670 [Flavobacteriales bacterium]